MTGPNRASHARSLIGVFTAQLEDAYQRAVWRGIEERAGTRGVGVVCFVGHRIASPVAEVSDYGERLPASIDGTSMGPRIMRYRAETAGAELHIGKLAPGTRISCRIDCSPGEL
jgi:hypothetical protein